MQTPEVPKKRERADKPTGGRPRKTDAERQLKGVTVRLSVKQYEKLQAHAVEGGQSLAHVVRSILNGKLPHIPPAQEDLLRTIATMANNWNQLAKKAHQNGFGTVSERVQQQAGRIEDLLNYFKKISGK